MKQFGIQFSNYHFKSEVIFTAALTDKEAIERVKKYVTPHRFEYERTLSEREVSAYSQEEIENKSIQ